MNRMRNRGAVVIRGDVEHTVCLHYDGPIPCPYSKKMLPSRIDFIMHLQNSSVNMHIFVLAVVPVDQAGVFVAAQPNAQLVAIHQPQHQFEQDAAAFGEQQVPCAHNGANMLVNQPLADLGAMVVISHVNEHHHHPNA